MDTKLPTSFIPKRAPNSGASKASGGILSVLATIIFVITVIISVGIFGYQRILQSRIQKMNIELTGARETLQPDVIKELSRANARFVAGQDLISKHTLITSLFNQLETQTLKSVRYSKFSYVADEMGKIVIGMSGEATSYATVALQLKVFSEDPNFKEPQFSNLDLDKAGNVTFAFKATVVPKLVSYNTFLESLTATQSSELPEETVTIPIETPQTQ